MLKIDNKKSFFTTFATFKNKYVFEYFYLLRYNAVQSGGSKLTFRRNIACFFRTEE